MEPTVHNLPKGILEPVRHVIHAPLQTVKDLKRYGEFRDINQAAMRLRPKRKVLVKR